MTGRTRKVRWGAQQAARLAGARQALGLSQRELAERVGASRQSVWEWESDRLGPHPRYVPLLCDALDVSPIWLLVFEDNPTLRDLRTAWGLSQPQIAELTGLTQSTISRVERGDWHPEDPEPWAAALGITVSEWERAWLRESRRRRR